jgi:PH (Pleckstrin Homology) domain-containing protein
MPDMPDAVTTVTIRPRRIRQVCWVLAIVVAVFFSILGALLSNGRVGQGTAVFQASDRYALVVLGLLAAGAILLFTRPKVVADRSHVRIQNVIGGYDLPWAVVRSIRFDRGSPWLTLELADDEVVAVMAIQAVDKQYAVAGAAALRHLFAASQSPPSPRSPRS